MWTEVFFLVMRTYRLPSQPTESCRVVKACLSAPLPVGRPHFTLSLPVRVQHPRVPRAALRVWTPPQQGIPSLRTLPVCHPFRVYLGNWLLNLIR